MTTPKIPTVDELVKLDPATIAPEVLDHHMDGVIKSMAVSAFREAHDAAPSTAVRTLCNVRFDAFRELFSKLARATEHTPDPAFDGPAWRMGCARHRVRTEIQAYQHFAALAAAVKAGANPDTGLGFPILPAELV